MAPPSLKPASSGGSSSDLTLMDPEPISETTPLFNGNKSNDAEDGPPPPPGKPLPKMQVFLLCFARAMEPIAFFAIFPFIAQMVQRNGNLPDSDVGFYSGIIESLFSAMQMFVLYFWGYLADTVGRKPVLLCSLGGMAAATFFFTVSTSIWQMMLWRCVAGIFSGCGLVIRTMLSDHTTAETQATAFSWFAFSNNVGIFVGPIMGGFLADPVEQFPGVFGGIKLLEDYPYLLVGVILTGWNLVSIILSALFLEETLEPRAETTTAGVPAPARQRLSTLELLKAPGVANVIWVYTHVMFLAFAFTAILPVLLFTPVDLGGVDFPPARISVWMAVQGLSQATWLIVAYPTLQRRLGTKGSLTACVVAWPFFFGGFIAMNMLLRIGTESSVAIFWVVAFLVACVGPGVSMAFTAVQLAVNDVAPNPHVLGTLNALAMTAASAIRSFVPGVATAIYAIGVRNQILWGHLAWAILIPLVLPLFIFVKWLPEDKQSHKLAQNEDEE